MKKRKQNTLVHALDVAAYIMDNRTNNSTMPAWKIHKLVYYCQVWSLIRDEQPLIKDKILASVHGVMIKELCQQHCGNIYVGSSTVGNVNHLSLTQIDTIDHVMSLYGQRSLEELDQMSRSESPWIETRKNLKSDDQNSVEISLETLIGYANTHKD